MGALSLICKKGFAESIVPHLDALVRRVSDHKEFVNLLFETGNGKIVAEHADKFKTDRSEIFDTLILNGYTGSALDNLHHWTWWIDDMQVETIIDQGYGKHLAERIAQVCPGVMSGGLQLLLHEGYSKEVALYFKNRRNFRHDTVKSVYSNVLAKLLIESGEVETLAQNVQKFYWLNLEVGEQLIDVGFGAEVAEHLSRSFEDVDYELAKILIEKGYAEQVMDGLFPEPGPKSDIWIVEYLVEKGYADTLKRKAEEKLSNKITSEYYEAQIHRILQTTEENVNKNVENTW